MISPDLPTAMNHETLIFSAIGVFLTVLGMVSAAAYAGAKLALRAVAREIAAVKELYDVEINMLKDSQSERKSQIANLQIEVAKRVLVCSCNQERIECGKGRSEKIDALAKNFEILTIDIKANSKLLYELNAIFHERTKHFDTLTTMIKQRANEFRPPTAEDLNA